MKRKEKSYVYRWDACIGGRTQGHRDTEQEANFLLDAIEAGQAPLQGTPQGTRRSVRRFRVYYEWCGQCGVPCLPLEGQPHTCEPCYIRIRGRSAQPDVPGALVFWRVTETDIMDNGWFPEKRPGPVYFTDLAKAETHYNHAVVATGGANPGLRRFHYWLEKVELQPEPDLLTLLNGNPKILRKIVIRSTPSEHP